MLKTFFWLLIFLILLLQFIFTLSSTNQIRYEELAESIRNVYWLQNRTIYDGISSNVGWYATLLLLYNFFGFSLNSAKFFRLILGFISFFCLVFILKKSFDVKKLLLPLLTIGLSPTFLYFNTLQTSYGLDLQYFPICLFLLFLNLKNKKMDLFRQVLFGMITMTAWLSYPVFVFYLPSLFGIYLYNLFQEKNKIFKNIFKNLLLSFFSFLFPLIISFLFIKDRGLLIYDPITKSGLFRGAGILSFNLNIFLNNLSHLFSDLFYKGSSYYFELPNPDFSSFYPMLSLIFSFTACTILLIKNKHFRFPVFLVLITLFFNLFVANFTFDPSGHPGIRRNTPLLASFYAFFVIAWYFFINKNWESIWLKWIIIGVFALLPAHHFLIYFENIYSLKTPSQYRELWFGLTNSPSDYLELTLKRLTKEDLKLSCKDKNGKLVFCRYSEIYAATAGACYWNKLECKNILGYDQKTQKFIPLSIELWEKYHFDH